MDRWFDSFESSSPTLRKAVAAARRLVEGEVDSLVLIGGPGCGKSTLLAMAANEMQNTIEAEVVPLREAYAHGDRSSDLIKRLGLAERIVDARCPRWLNVGRTILDLKAQMSRGDHAMYQELESLRSTRGLLVLDDLGRERISDWTAEVLYAVVSERYDRQLPTAVSSNVAAADLQRLGYGAIVSRLAERGLILELSAPDYRLRLRADAVA